MSILLEVSGLTAGYGRTPVLRDVSLQIDEGQIAVLLGANGAGKTTTLRALCGIIPSNGVLSFRGQSISGQSLARTARLGMSLVPQGRGTFPELTVRENLEIGAYLQPSRLIRKQDLQFWLERFPRLDARQNQRAGTLSGGEQQMLAIARAMMSRPRLLLLDEPSLGLAPLLVQELFSLLKQLNKDLGTSMLVVEQNAELALDIADRGFVLETGTTVLAGTAEDLRANEAIRRAYLGV